MKALKLLLTLLTAISFSLATVVPASAQAADEGERYRPKGREIARELSDEFDKAMYEVRTYTPDVSNVDEFLAATVFYPLTLSFTKATSAVVFVPGYQGKQEMYDWWGPTLASLGIAVMIIDTNEPKSGFLERAQAHIAAVKFLKNEIENNSESPINGKVDTNKIAIMGHSLGGGSALAAAAELGDEIAAVMPIMPYCCELGKSFEADYSELSAPTLIITATGDNLVPPKDHARILYDAIADSTDKVYIEFVGGDHNLPLNFGSELKNQARFVFSWMELHTENDTNFSSSFNDSLSDEIEEKITLMQTSL